MATSVWFSVIVLCSFQQVFASECRELDKIQDSCNECIRCGGIWCNAINVNVRCSLDSDGWCPHNRVTPALANASSVPGSAIDPRHVERSVKVGGSDRIRLQYHHTLPEPTINIKLINSTIQDATLQSFNVSVERTTCDSGKCISTVDVKPKPGFCPSSGTNEELITFRMHIEGVAEDATATYHVPCACDCTGALEKYSEQCNKRGDLSCGVCSCHKGWQGNNCEEIDPRWAPAPKPKDCDRGDIPSCNHPITNLICSNNGRCGPCGTCECFTHREGSQYYGEYCADICTTASLCDSCLANPTPGECKDCHFTMIIENYNETLVDERDATDRKVWVRCNETVVDCLVEYVAMKNSLGEIHVMVIDACKTEGLALIANGLNITVPVVLGVVALVAAAAAGAGVAAWRARAAPLPLADPHYTNIGAEDCTGENPLYKPPTSSFKNPTYGKW